ncbi:MAG: hypothetical protein QXN63_03115 [Candidatus Bathyarchaeia archaeon]
MVKEIGNKKIGFFVYECIYFRVLGTVSCSVFLYQTEANSCEIVIVGSGGEPLAGISWGAHGDIEEKFAKAILNYCKRTRIKGYDVSSNIEETKSYNLQSSTIQIGLSVKALYSLCKRIY